VTASREYPRIVVPPPGPRARAVVSKHDEFASTSLPKEYPLVIARGDRAMVEDVDGNRYLDFMAGIAVTSTGYNHPAVVAAVQEAAEQFLHICGSDFYFEKFSRLCERLARLAPGPSKKRVFLCNSGTEAVEGAMKLARHSTGRSAFVAFTGSFHGRTYGALSLTASKAVQRAGFGPFLPEVYHVSYPYPYRCDFGRAAEDCGKACIRQIEEDLFAKRLDPRSVAAVFVEPIQGEGGYVVPPAGFLRDLRALCGVVQVGEAGVVELQIGAAEGGQRADLGGVGRAEVVPELVEIRIDALVDG
jgi:4-aminobutyrate aminotransferase